MGFGGWGKIAMNGDAKIDPEGGQGLARTVQPVERKRERERRDSIRTKAELLFQRRKFHFCVPTTFLTINLCIIAHHW